MRLISRVVLAAAISVAVVPHAYAQTAAQTAGVNQPWSFGVGFNGSYEGNALFVGPEDNEEFANQVFASIGRLFTLKRGGIQLDANVNQAFYQETASLNDFRYTVGGSGSYQLTHRLGWSGSAMAFSGLAHDSKVLLDSGLVLPSVTARTVSSSSSFAYLLSRRSTLTWTLGQQRVGFGSSESFGGGSSVDSSLSYARQVGHSQTVGVTQEYRRTFGGLFDESMFRFLGTWSYTAGSGWTASASGGVMPYAIGDGAYHSTTSYAGSFSKPVRPGQTFGVSYNKGMEQSFGTETTSRIMHTLYGNYGMGLFRKLSLNFGGSYSRGSSPLTPGRLTIGETVQATLSVPVTRKLAVSFGSSLFSRIDDPAPRVNSYRSFLSVAYNTTWR